MRPEWRKETDRMAGIIGITAVLSGIILIVLGFVIYQYNKGVRNQILSERSFQEAVYTKVTDGLYCTQTMLDARERLGEKNLNRYLDVVAGYLKEVRPGQEFIIRRYNIGPGPAYDGAVFFYLRQLVSGRAQVRDTDFIIIADQERVREMSGNGREFNIHDREPVPENGLLSSKEIGKTVAECTKEYYKGEPVQGEYILEMTLEDQLIWLVYVNQFSSVELDARTGEVLRTHFWDGIMD